MASIQHRRAELYGIEAKATHGAWQDIEDTPSEAEIETSKAISAKRQADALERIAEFLTNPDSLIQFHGQMTNLAWECGRSFAAGQRVG